MSVYLTKREQQLILEAIDMLLSDYSGDHPERDALQRLVHKIYQDQGRLSHE